MKWGTVSIVGKPNVGKSTLINTIFEKEVVIWSNKPQTTRNMIEISYCKDNDYMINFIDTPGLHKPQNKLDLFLNSEVKLSLKKSDLILFLFDVSRSFDSEDQECLKVLQDFQCRNVFLILNKKDLKSKNELKEINNFVKKQFSFLKILRINAKNKDDISQILKNIVTFLQEYEGSVSDLKTLQSEISDRFFIGEIIREIIINLFHKEIPYGIAVLIDDLKYEKKKNLLSIIYSIVVEKESQKPIIIGKNGTMVKKINTILRTKLLDVYDCKIFTSSHVKVRKNWRNNVTQIKELGYKK